MVEIVKELIAHQFDAALCTLGICIDRCPDDLWNTRIGNQSFNLVAFHTLFFTDYYLGQNADSLRQQPFHKEHAEVFADYEQLEYREPVSRYERPFIEAYMHHCRRKAAEVIESETQESLTAKADFARRNFSRAELYVYSTRHIQHHSAQLSLRLRLDAKMDIPWVQCGWQET